MYNKLQYSIRVFIRYVISNISFQVFSRILCAVRVHPEFSIKSLSQLLIYNIHVLLVEVLIIQPCSETMPRQPGKKD